jgi:hypothetical protein
LRRLPGLQVKLSCERSWLGKGCHIGTAPSMQGPFWWPGPPPPADLNPALPAGRQGGVPARGSRPGEMPVPSAPAAPAPAIKGQRVAGKAKAAKAKSRAPRPADEAARKVAKEEVPLGLLASLMPHVMNGRRPVNAHPPVVNMPIHLLVGRALAVADKCPEGEENGKGRSKSRNSRSGSPRSAKPCHFFKQGKCKNGDNC